MGFTSEEGYGVEGYEPFHKSAAKVHGSKCCKHCGSEQIVKWGIRNGQQKWKCKTCGKYFLMNGCYPRMRTDYRVIGTAMEWYFSGFSLRKVQWQLKRIFNVSVARSTILRWIEKYVPKIKEFLSRFHAPGSGIWHADETVVKAGGGVKWYFDVIDRETRFIVSARYADTRTLLEARELFREAHNVTERIPSLVVCDRLQIYPRAIRSALGCHPARRMGICAGRGPGSNPSNARIERFHNTLKERTKIMRGLWSRETGESILDGFVIFYNWLRPHQSLDGRTPAEAMGLSIDVERGFNDLIQYSLLS